jgi:hypothetical protein
MENQEELVKVVIDTLDPDVGVGGERVWAFSLGNDLYEIRNSPWYARNVNWGDWVRAIAPSDDKWPVFVSVVKRSGHRTIHVILLEGGFSRREQILREITRLGASYENNNDKMYALDCPPEVDVAPIIQYLENLETNDVVEFEINLSE